MPTIGPPGYLLIVNPLGSSSPGSSMISVFHRPRNSIAVLLAADYLPDDGEMQVTAGYGENFGDIDEDNPQYIEVFRTDSINSTTGLILDLSGRSVYEVVGRTDDTLTVVIADGYTDQAFSAGDKIYGFLQAEHIRELQDAVNALEADAGGSTNYTNATPMPEAVGGYDAGTTFDSVQFSDLMDGLLYPYQSPAFTAFAISGQATTVEVGTTVSGTKTFTWSTSNSANVAANSLSIADESGPLQNGLADDGSEAIAVGSVQRTTPGTYTWTIAGMNTNTPPAAFDRDFSITWLWKVYAGTSVSATLNEAEIEGLSDYATLTNSAVRTYVLSAGGYKYLAIPASFTAPSSFKDEATGFNVPMADSSDDAAYSGAANGLSYATVSVTNAQSQVTTYRVYRTKNTVGAALNLVVA
jgi:hypothetical protein